MTKKTEDEALRDSYELYLRYITDAWRIPGRVADAARRRKKTQYYNAAGQEEGSSVEEDEEEDKNVTLKRRHSATASEKEVLI